MMSILEGRINRNSTTKSPRNIDSIPGIVVNHPPRQSA